MPIFKGPLFPRRKAKKPTETFASDPVAHGNIDEQDFSAQRAGRPTRDEAKQRKSKESKEDEQC